ncbi:DUF2723 domain-containing protein [bacterium]|nr:DUF2723 domain-containing protein [bacterium]
MEQDTRLINRRWLWIMGGVVFVISYLTYLRSVAPTTSFWDCGEFIACSYQLSVMHPPGAPLYLLIGRILTMVPIVGDIGLRVNLFSVFVSAATILLTFLVIEQLIRRWRGEAKHLEDRLIIYGSAAFGALAFAFTDSFWFNAVEAEVYAFSMLFTALVVWLALYWGEHSRRESGLLLIFFIFYLFGLAIGVHLLNILAFPFVILIAYFHDNIHVRRLLMLITVQALLPMLLYVVFYQFDPSKMGYEQLVAHQAKAASFLKWFGLAWVTATMVYIYTKDRYVFKAWWIVPGLILISYSVYLVIYLRAGLNPPINENNPSTWTAMQDYLARKQYGEEDMFLTFLYRKADFWRYQIHFMYTRYFGWQFIGQGVVLDAYDRVRDVISFRGLMGLPFIVGLWGAVHHFYKDWKRALAVFILFLATGYAIIIYLDQKDPQPRERDYSYVGSFFAFSIWIGIGMAGILEWISRAFHNREGLKKAAYAAAVILLLAAVPVNLFSFNFHSHDRQGNYIASDYSYNLLQTCEKDAIIFTNGDNDTFPLWYLQEVEGVRKDVRVVNLSLLNTPWYIKQLKHEEPKVPVAMSDQAIEAIQPMAWKAADISVPVPGEVIDSLKPRLSERELETLQEDMVFNLQPTFTVGTHKLLRVQDLMLMQILNANRWKRPIYIAVTVAQDSKAGLDEYLRMDGLAYRVCPYKPESIDPEILTTNLMDKYRYRNLDNPSVFINLGSTKLLQNYRSAFQQLAQHYIVNNNIEEARNVLEALEERIPEAVVPFGSEQSAMFLASFYQKVGEDPDLERRLQNVVPGFTPDRRTRFGLADYYARVMQEWGRAEEILLEIIDGNANDVEAYSYLAQIYVWSGQYDKAIALLQEWIAGHPTDPNAKAELKRIMAMAEEAADSSTASDSGVQPIGEKNER